jgi:hypothetical protein
LHAPAALALGLFVASAVAGDLDGSRVVRATPSQDSPDIMPLAGEWRFAMDRQDAGDKDGWFRRDLEGRVRLPGSMAENGLGDPVTNVRQQVWGGQWTHEPVWHPMVRTDYRGAAWYQTTVRVPENWREKHLELLLERVCWQSELWVDETSLGRRDSLSAPHRYEIGPLPPGLHRLTLRIDNRPLHDLGCNTHAYHEGSCTIYNGVIGRMELQARPPVFVRADEVYADPASGRCELRLTVANRTGREAACTVTASILQHGHSEPAGTARQEATVPPGDSPLSVGVTLPAAAVRRWSEFDRPLYEARVVIQSGGSADDHRARFGFRIYATRGPQFLINGKPVLLRGEANNAQFPLTGHPPMDRETWLRIFGRLKDFGLNHVRFHAWVPPEAAFDAADELGFYLQPELPNGEDSVARDSARGLSWREAEFDRILSAYGNHPSFVQMTMGNEAKTPQIDFLKQLVRRGKERDPRRLFATISNPEASGIRDEVPGDDFAVAHGSAKGRRRMEPFFNRDAPETMGDYRATIEGRPVPQISHETGQWYVYPDLAEIGRYTGVLRAVTLEHFRDTAQREGVLDQAPDFLRAGGALSRELYKEEIERSLRTPQYGGFQLLGLQDSFDQGAAYVGMINSFFEPKPFVTAAAFREFCGPQVPLARFAKRVWTSDETFAADLEMANYGPGPLSRAVPEWRVLAGEAMLMKGELPARDIPDEGLAPLGRIVAPLCGVAAARRLRLEVGIRGTSLRNRWNFWVYPKDAPPDPPGVRVVQTLDGATMQALREGARVALLPSGFSSSYGTAMTPPFWSPIMFSNQKQVLGMLCDPGHPALRDFPNDGHSDWAWYELLFQGSVIRLKGAPAGWRPIVQAIDRPDRNHLLAAVYEIRVGRGKLLVCTLDLNRDLAHRPVARQLRHSLLAYAAGPDFQPVAELPLEGNLPVALRASSWLASRSPKISASTEHENNWAIYALDDNPDTIWHSNWNPPEPPLPHALTIELKEPVRVKGFVQTPRTDCDHGRIANYTFQVSEDGRSWQSIAEGDWPNTADPKRVLLAQPVRSRFFRLESRREVQGRLWTSVAEIDLIPADEGTP